MYSDNNLFRFATKELSQDAILAWTVNGINGQDESLKALGKALLKAMVGWKGDIDFSDVVVLRQVKNMDILISFMCDGTQHLVIVEDKVGSSVHDNQLERYTKASTQFINDEEEANHTLLSYDAYSEKIELHISRESKLHVVYIKTRLVTDKERFALKRLKESHSPMIRLLDGKELLDIYGAFHGENAIIDMFIEHIEKLQRQIEEKEEKLKGNDVNGQCILELSQTDIGQWYLMKEMLPTDDKHWRILDYPSDETEKNQKHTEIDILWNDTNGKGGDPYTELWFWGEACRKSDKGPFYKGLYWRLDPGYLSLAYYVDYGMRSLGKEGLPAEEKEQLNKCSIIIEEVMRGIAPEIKKVCKLNPVSSHKKNTLLTVYLSERERPRIESCDLLEFDRLKEFTRKVHREFVKSFNDTYQDSHPSAIELLEED